jgi:hypothetical protein
MGSLILWVKRQGTLGYLCLDDVVIEKAFAKRLAWAGWTYSFAKKREVYGLHVVVLLWCSSDGRWRIPVAFRLWRPKHSCRSHAYRTKLQLAEARLKEILGQGLCCRYVVFDTHYTAGWFTKLVGRLGLIWVGTLHPRTIVYWRGRRQSVRGLPSRLPLRWRSRLGMRARAVRLYAPKYGTLRLVVIRNRHGNFEYIATNQLSADLPSVVERKMSRSGAWGDPISRYQAVRGLGGVPVPGGSGDGASRWPGVFEPRGPTIDASEADRESVGSVKERWQMALVRDGESPPVPLKACPTHLRVTA